VSWSNTGRGRNNYATQSHSNRLSEASQKSSSF
jgi:hypothetical protein